MTHQFGETMGVYARLSTCRMTATERLDAAAALQRGEALADWLGRTAGDFRQAIAEIGRILRRMVQRQAGQGQSPLGRSYRYEKR